MHYQYLINTKLLHCWLLLSMSLAGISSSLGQLGGLASLAGVNFGNTGSSETEMAKAIMISWNFIEDFINKNTLLLSFMLLRVGIKIK